MAKNTENTIKVDVMGLDNLMDILETIRQRLDEHDTRGSSLAQRLETRIAAIEQRLADLEEPQGHPDDVRDALAELDAMTTKLDGFPPQDNVICWPPFDPDQPDQTLFMWRVADDENSE